MIKKTTLLVIIIAFFAIFVSCSSGPDGKSGKDQFRNFAKTIEIGKWDIDKVNYSKADKTDWKKFVLPEANKIKIELKAKAVQATVIVELFDTFGKFIDKGVKIKGDDRPLVISKSLDAGRYFIKLRNMEDSDSTNYSLRVSIE